jgi:putative transposase
LGTDHDLSIADHLQLEQYARMPRRPRLILPGVPLHLIQRGNNRQACFFDEDDRHAYLKWLEEYARSSACAVHAYVLMTNHVHLLISSDSGDGPARLMKALGQRYVQYLNRRHRRSGTLWEGRFRSCLVESEAYLLACQRYIELNPVRARIAAQPEEYPWSSYSALAHGAPNPLVQPHPLYLALGDAPDARQRAYQALFQDRLAPAVVDAIRHATNGNFVLGDARFAGRIGEELGRRVTPGKAGRPRKSAGLSETAG